MKKALFIILFIIGFNSISFTQNMSSEELCEYIVDNYRPTEAVNCSNSSVLVKVHYYNIDNDNTGYVIAYIKKNNYDMHGKPYVYCSVPRNAWQYFKVDGQSSWGSAFNKYITKYGCK